MVLLQHFNSSEMFNLNATNNILVSWIIALTFYEFLCLVSSIFDVSTHRHMHVCVNLSLATDVRSCICMNLGECKILLSLILRNCLHVCTYTLLKYM